MLNTLIPLVLANLNLVFFICAFLVAAIYSRARSTPYRVELLPWMLFLSGALQGLYTFVMHVFFPQISSANIGWARSPFEYEVGMANLAIGVTCLFVLRASYSYRLAAGIVLSVWLAGDAVGHIIQMVKTHDFSPGNAGSWFWTDILIPGVVMTLLWLNRPHQKIEK